MIDAGRCAPATRAPRARERQQSSAPSASDRRTARTGRPPTSGRCARARAAGGRAGTRRTSRPPPRRSASTQTGSTSSARHDQQPRRRRGSPSGSESSRFDHPLCALAPSVRPCRLRAARFRSSVRCGTMTLKSFVHVVRPGGRARTSVRSSAAGVPAACRPALLGPRGFARSASRAPHDELVVVGRVRVARVASARLRSS